MLFVPPRQLQPHIIQGLRFGFLCPAYGEIEMLRCLRQRMLRIIIEAEAITQILFALVFSIL